MRSSLLLVKGDPMKPKRDPSAKALSSRLFHQRIVPVKKRDLEEKQIRKEMKHDQA